MRVFNPHPLAYSLLTASGDYEVLEAGETRDYLELHPSVVEDYRGKGFEIESTSTETPENGPVYAAPEGPEGVTTREPDLGQNTAKIEDEQIEGQQPGDEQDSADADPEDDEEGDEEGDDEGDEDQPNDPATSPHSTRRNRRRR